MKRSEINAAIVKAKARLEEFNISLPFFGYMTPDEWKAKKDEIGRIRERMLGWDVTDFGSDDFAHCGAVLFTVRNGDKNDKEYKAPYAEKYIILDDTTGQEIPLHYHIDKTEDIICRAGGVLVVQMYGRAADGGLDQETPIKVWMDGVLRTFKAGENIYITPGNSITLEPFTYHRFFAEEGKGLLIVGEVSKVNDDDNDNIFLKPSERFTAIEEDEAPVHPLCKEYNF